MITVTAESFACLHAWHVGSFADASLGAELFWVVCLFGGDRLSAVADGGAIFVREDELVIAVASYSMAGEYGGPDHGLGLPRRRLV